MGPMTRGDAKLLNLSFLDNRLRELGLKRWWLAEQLGVDRRTVTRWLTGQVKWVQEDNLRRLAGVLTCEVEQLILSDSTDAFSSREEQAEAARLIDRDNLASLLGPAGKWSLVESLVKATLRPELPRALLGTLYNQLSIAAWRQGKFADGQQYAEKALALGEATDNRAVVASARTNLGTLHAYGGRLVEAAACYRLAVREHRYLETALEHGKALSNLATVEHDAGEFQESVITQQAAIEVFTSLDEPASMPLSIAQANLCRALTDLERYAEATEAGDESERHADAGGYRRGQAFAMLLRADIAARQQHHELAEAAYREGMRRFVALGIDEALNYAYGARIARLARHPDVARQRLKAGLALAQDFPLERAGLLVEEALLLELLNDPRAELCRSEARAIYQASGAERRAGRL